MNISLPRKALVLCLLFTTIYLMFIFAACSSKNDSVESDQASKETEEHKKAIFHKVPAAREDENPNGGRYQRSPAFWVTSGSENLDIADQRRAEAMTFFSKGDLGRAEPLLIEALKLYENALEADNIDLKNQIIREYIEAYRYLYILYSETNRHDEAEKILKKGKLALAEKFQADDHTISFFIKSIENFKKQQAERHYIQQQFESQHNNHQVESPLEIANKNRIIGNKHFFEKEYDKAEHYFQLVLDYCDANSHQAPDLCCKAMNDMGALKLGIVQSDEGFTYFESALSLAEKHFHPDHIIIADTLVNIGHYYSSIADYRNALAPYERALRIFENSYGPNHPSVLQVYFALGRLYLFEDNIDKASFYNGKAMVGIAGTLGTDNELYARCLFNLGFLHHRKKEYDQAEKSYTQAIDIWEKGLGPTNYPQAITYTLLARLHSEKGDFEKAVRSLLKCHQLESIVINQITDFTSESQQLYRAEGDIITLQKYLNFIGNYYQKDQIKVREAFNTWLTGKGRILDVQARLHESNLADGNPESVKLFQELAEVRSKLSKLAFSQPGTVDGVAYKQEKDSLEREKNRLEAQLSRISKPFALKRKMEIADSEQVAKTLPSETVLLEFARTQAMRIDHQDKSVDSYIAFILHAGDGKDVGMVHLGDAGQIDDLIAKYKKGLSVSGEGKGKNAVATSRQLYNLVFHPLVKYLGTSKDIFVSPDGNLSLIPFEVLQKPDGSFLIEEYTFNYLSAGRDLVGFPDGQAAEGKCLLMGAPDFNCI